MRYDKLIGKRFVVIKDFKYEGLSFKRGNRGIITQINDICVKLQVDGLDKQAEYNDEETQMYEENSGWWILKRIFKKNISIIPNQAVIGGFINPDDVNTPSKSRRRIKN